MLRSTASCVKEAETILCGLATEDLKASPTEARPTKPMTSGLQSIGIGAVPGELSVVPEFRPRALLSAIFGATDISDWFGRNTLFRFMVRISSRVFFGMLGRPAFPWQTFQVQHQRKPRRCQSMTVSGVTSTSADRHRDQNRERKTHKRRSADFSRGFGIFRSRTVIRCRRATISS